MDNIALQKIKDANLSQEERDLILSMMKEVEEKGFSDTLNKLELEDYKEIPVDIETFLDDDNYLGKAWKDSSGKTKLYPFWRKVLKDIFPNNLDTNYDTLLESGARGLGKSENACGAVCSYMMYRVMCLKNPLEYYHLKLTEKIAFAFMNIKLDLSEAIATDKFQKTIQMSPWFMSKGTMTRRKNKDFWLPPDPIELIIGSQADDIIGRPIFFAFFDEISFLKNQDVEEQKKKALNMIDTALGGMKTRFIHNGKNPTLLVVASSKRSEQSFMESYIRTLKETQKENIYVVDEPVWKVKPEGTYSKDTFYVGLGNKFLESVVVPDTKEETLKKYREKGYDLIEVPIDFRAKAIENLDRMLCDYAGISSFSSNKFINAARLSAIVSKEIHNPMPDVIEVGDGVEDKNEYEKFFDLEKIPKEYKNKPLFIHLDMSISGDKTGIAGVWIIGKKPTSDGNPGKDLYFQPAFSFSVKAPHGRQISFAKNRNFIRWLKEKEFKIKHITSDTFQAYNLQQDLKAEGFTCSILSVDRVEQIPGEHVGICKPYEYLRNTIQEGRIKFYETDLLYNELVQLEKDNNSGKVDHPPKGCFTGNTKVSLVDGRQLTFLELIDEYNQGKENYVYSMNLDTHKIEAKKIKKAWKTLENQPLIKVTLDNGEYIECTLNHKFMLRDGTYIEAQDLIPGDSLMPLYTKVSQKGLQGYRMYYEPFEDVWHYEHRKFAKDVLDEKYLVHHLDFNKLNNSPSNLLWMSKKEHIRIHSKEQSGAYSEEANNKRKQSIKEWHQNMRGTIKYEERANKLRIAGTNFEKQQQKQEHIKELENLFNVKWDSLSGKEKNHYSQLWVRMKDPTLVPRIAQSISNNHKAGKYRNAKIALDKCNKHNQTLKELFPNIDKEEFESFFGFDYYSLGRSHRGPWSNRYRQKKYELLNHKVVSIEILDRREDVYDIEVEDNHNFALASGIFVHNSKDQADAICGAVYTASSYAEDYAYNYGEDMIDSFLDSNPMDDQTIKKQMMIDIQKELAHLDPLANYHPHNLTPKDIDEDDDKDDEEAELSDGILIW